ncbi:MAG TPA: complex I subunit 1 family protein, partial [Candidatus Krumholzibacteria bacterium]|nr:complex I subunit 1 family protein [Candidatus Krumholzibacteria bacterium]
RKVVSRFQDRIGPNRVGPFGLIQPFADIIKLIIKEDTTPGGADKVVYNIAPMLSMMSVLILWAVVPLAPTILGVDLNIGALYIIAAGAIGTLSIIMAGWSSNNKFALLGGLRSTAQMISYEIPLGLALVGVFMVYGSAQLNEIVRGQGELLFGFLPKWGLFVQPLGAILFITAAFAETNRNPFDLPEGESEIVAGYHVEYSGMRFALFYMGEYVAIVLASAMIATLYFGGWQVPYFPTEKIIATADTWLKVMLGVGGAGALAFALLMLVWARRMKVGGGFGDLRDKEGIVLGVAHIVIGGAMLFFFWKTLSLEALPDWGARTVAVVAQISSFALKTIFWCWVFIWVRWSLPRFRYDQLMRLGWKQMIPLCFVNIFVTGLVILWMGR